ncbi:hypothetical protein CCR75_006147 [Bremia lactucae]|uniref:Uncharacterized protein n=1 Tax=Bremia lactucae TaxID=4779 RepID=A0A976FNA6_BRELC|nr:hypothetical protein CCR75_006367 [Bremia lactucae]TDH71791.1 hypothetical protein CCR75_006147 [Bremia lactucae]
MVSKTPTTDTRYSHPGVATNTLQRDSHAHLAPLVDNADDGKRMIDYCGGDELLKLGDPKRK